MNSKEIKFAADDSLIAQLNSASQSANVNRATFIREAVQFRLNANQLPSHTKLPTATRAVLKAAHGKLSRVEADHIVAVVVNALHSDS